MAIEVVTKFTRKGDVRSIAYVKDDDGTLTNCTNAKITIEDQEGTTMINANAMNCTTTGVYEHYLSTNANCNLGEWRSEVDINDDGVHSFTHGGFTLEEGL